jgi:hypothetical protein
MNLFYNIVLVEPRSVCLIPKRPKINFEAKLANNHPNLPVVTDDFNIITNYTL